MRSIIDPLTSDFGVPAEWTTIVVGLMILVFVVLQRVVSAVGKKNDRHPFPVPIHWWAGIGNR